MAHRAIESLAGREQRLHTSRRWIGAVFAAGTDRISSEADNHCTEQNCSNDIIAVHGGDPRSPPARHRSPPLAVPRKGLAVTLGRPPVSPGVAWLHGRQQIDFASWL